MSTTKTPSRLLDDPAVRPTRRVRERISKAFGHDVGRLAAFLRKREASHPARARRRRRA